MKSLRNTQAEDSVHSGTGLEVGTKEECVQRGVAEDKVIADFRGREWSGRIKSRGSGIAGIALPGLKVKQHHLHGQITELLHASFLTYEIVKCLAQRNYLISVISSLPPI